MPGRRIHIGTSGWTYDDWSGPFYPPEVKGADRLAFYAERFDTVEVNATFYRNPTENMVEAWNRRLGSGFHLVLKGSRRVTHFQKLVDMDEPLGTFLKRALEFKRLKVILWQLPPSLRKDLDRLDGFLTGLPKKVRHAVEFRHKSWWDEKVADVLNRHRAAFVSISHPKLPDDVPPTTNFLYVRFHGLGKRLYDYDYSDDELSGWVAKLKPLLKGRTLYAFFNNDWHANAPKNAMTFREMLTEV